MTKLMPADLSGSTMASSTARTAGRIGFGAAAAGGEHVALGRFSGQGDDGDTGRRDGVRQPGHERDAQIGGHEPHHRLPVARAVGDPRRVARALAPGHEHLVARPPDRRRDPLRVAQLREVDLVAGPPGVVERQDGVEDVAEQLLAVVARIIRARSGAALHRQDHVHLAGGEQHHRLVGLRLQHAQLELRRARAQRPRGGRDRPASEVGKPAHAHLAARRGVLRRELALHPLHLGEQRVRVAEQHVRGGREPHRAPVRLQQRRGRPRAPAPRAAGTRHLTSSATRRRPSRACRGRPRPAASGACADRPSRRSYGFRSESPLALAGSSRHRLRPCPAAMSPSPCSSR